MVVVPNHSNPSGATLAVDRRVALGALARSRYGFVILEDDAYHGLGFSGPPPAPIRIHAPDHTVTLGSASKMIAPGLRIGWLGAPAWLAPTLTLVKQTLDLHTSTLDQLVVAEILRDEAFLAAHLDPRPGPHRRAGRARSPARSPGVVATRVPTGGMFCWGTARTDTRAALAGAVAAGVAYVPGRRLLGGARRLAGTSA